MRKAKTFSFRLAKDASFGMISRRLFVFIPPAMKFVSWNVNGIRACVNKGFLDYLSLEKPDVIALQEVKAKEDQNPIWLELAALGYEIYWHHAERPGYSGTAIFTKVKPISISYTLGGVISEDNEGRVTTMEFEDFFFITVYTPNAKRGLERLEYRQLWDSFFLAHLKNLEETKPVIVCGDLNVAHEDIDLANPRENRWNAGFTDEERDGFRKFLSAGLVDTFRYFYPTLPGAYTWWSNFAGARARNIGWRIDYFLVSSVLKERLENAFIRQGVLGSDHCPIGIEIR